MRLKNGLCLLLTCPITLIILICLILISINSFYLLPEIDSFTNDKYLDRTINFKMKNIFLTKLVLQDKI